LAPIAVLLVFTGLVPWIPGMYYSFFSYNLLSAESPKYIGLTNFRTLVFDQEFITSLVRGVTFSISSALGGLFSGLVLALILYKRFKGVSFFKVVMCLPLAIPPIAIGSMWKLMLNPQVGPIPYYLSKIGITYNITADSGQAFLTTLLLDVWHWLPLSALVLLAGLSTIPRDVIEAADVDGAEGISKFRHVILPMIKYECLLVVLIRFMDSFRIFDEVWMLTAGGPGSATRYLSIYLYSLVLRGWNMGYGAAFSLVFFYIIEVFSWILFRTISGGGK